MREYNIRFIPGLDCFFNSLYVYLEGINRANPLIFSEIWNFVYEDCADENPSQLIGLKAEDDMDYEKYSEFLKRYCGVELFNVRESDPDKTIAFIRKQLEEDRPVGFFWDTFWCPWHEDYKKAHHPHACLIIDGDKDSLTCLDPIVIPRKGILKLEDFKDGYIGLYFGIRVLDTYEKSDYKEVLRNSVRYIEEHNKFENMEKFIDDFTENFDIRKEFANLSSSLYDVKFYTNIRQMAGYGFLYGFFLENVGEVLHIDKLGELAVELRDLYEDWSSVLGEFLLYHNGNYSVDIHRKMIHKFERLLQRERNIYFELKKISSQL